MLSGVIKTNEIEEHFTKSCNHYKARKRGCETSVLLPLWLMVSLEIQLRLINLHLRIK